MPSQYVDFPEPGGPITSCANGMFVVVESDVELLEISIEEARGSFGGVSAQERRAPTGDCLVCGGLAELHL